jgi:hypothetical protein
MKNLQNYRKEKRVLKNALTILVIFLATVGVFTLPAALTLTDRELLEFFTAIAGGK